MGSGEKHMDTELKKTVEDYIENRLTIKKEPEDDSLLIATWEKWLAEMEPVKIINEKLIAKHPYSFTQPSEIAMELYDSIGGTIPVIIFGNDDDFEHFVINATYKGEWTDEVKKQGAAFLFGKMNRFIALSKKPYSNVEASWMGLTEDEWREKSMIIRRSHECTHYYTRRYYGSARQNLHDELIADFFGIYDAFGRYEARWFNHFMGLDGRKDGRMSIYTVDLPKEACKEIYTIAGRCSAFLENWSKTAEFADMTRTQRIDYLCHLGIANFIVL